MRWFACLLATACAGATGPRVSVPATLEQASLAANAQAVAETWMRVHPPERLAWNWGEGVLVYGLWRLYRATGHDALRAYVAAYVRAHQARGVEIAWSDDTTPGLAAAELVLAGDAGVRPALERVIGYVMEAPRTEAQGLVRHLGRRVPAWLAPRALFPDVWVDSLFHFTITLCRYSRLTGDARYRDQAVYQLAGFLRNLQDPASGLVTHAYNDHPRDQQVPAFARRAFWARGNGWALVSLIEVLQELDEAHPARGELSARAQRLAAGLRACARSRDGLYHTLLLDPSSYVETAGSALIVYGLAAGARAGIFGGEEREAARRGMRGLYGVLEQRALDLEVSGTSLGTHPNARRYRRVPRRNQVSYGVGAWLLAASGLLESSASADAPDAARP